MIGVLLAAGLSAAGAAGSDGLFAEMKAVCLDTAADPKAAEAAARARGWTDAAGRRNRNETRLSRTMPQGAAILSLQAERDAGEVHNTCSLTAAFDEPGLTDQAGAWTGVAPKPAKDMTVFTYLEKDGEKLPQSEVGRFASLADLNASMRMLAVASSGRMSFISYRAPGKNPQ